MRSKKPVQFMLTVLCVLQIMLIVLLITNRVLIYFGILPDNSLSNADFLLIIVVIIFGFAFFMLFKGLQVVTVMNQKQDAQAIIIRDINELNKQIRAQRHDFLNHIQVLYSLLEMNEYDEAAKYLNRLYGEIEQINKFIKTSNLAINALLQAKYNNAKRLGILFKIDISTNLSKLKMPSWELCRVLGNLIDNALFEADRYENGKYVCVSFTENLKSYQIKVTNSGNIIPDDIKTSIFESGFTTKGEKGEGMGLYIVKNIVSEYGGTIEFSSENNETTFVLNVM